MNLETRVETIEHELKILKNEIESTLLEIQNQVLIHYYPALRAEESAPPKYLLPLAKSSFTERRDETQEQESLGSRTGRDDSHTLPKTREVSLSDLKGKPKKEPMLLQANPTPAKEQAASSKKEAPPWPAVGIDQAALPHLARWVNDSVEKIGKELTQNMIESSAGAEYAAQEVTDLLLHFITLCDEENPPEQVDTRELMDVLLKLNKVLSQVEKIIETPSHAKEEDRGQGDHNDLHHHR